MRWVTASPTWMSALSVERQMRSKLAHGAMEAIRRAGRKGLTSIITASLLSVALREPRKSLGMTSAAGSMASWPDTVGKSTVCSSVTRYLRPAASMLYSFWSWSCSLQKPVNAGA